MSAGRVQTSPMERHRLQAHPRYHGDAIHLVGAGVLPSGRVWATPLCPSRGGAAAACVANGDGLLLSMLALSRKCFHLLQEAANS